MTVGEMITELTKYPDTMPVVMRLGATVLAKYIKVKGAVPFCRLQHQIAYVLPGESSLQSICRGCYRNRMDTCNIAEDGIGEGLTDALEIRGER